MLKNEYKSVIDCGGGVWTQEKLLKEKKIDINYVGTEITKKFVDIGIERGLEIYHCPTQNMTVPDNYCEIAICLAVLNHQVEFVHTISELLRVAEKEVLISFFKPFLDDRNGIKEVKHCIEKFGVAGFDKNIGISIKRHNKYIYTFFSKRAIEEYLKSLKVDYYFKVLKDDTIVLHISKRENK